MILYSFRKNKVLPLLAVLFFLIFSPSVSAQHHSKNSKKDLESKKKRINEEIREINSLLSETKASKKNSIGALVNINMKLEKRQDLINLINAQIRNLDKEIKKNETETGVLKNNLEKLKKEYARMIVF